MEALVYAHIGEYIASREKAGGPAVRRLSSEQLSSQDHYDFGMRAVNTVIQSAGILKKTEPDMDEELQMLRAMRDSNLPKFLRDDTLLFRAIIRDLFPGVTEPKVTTTRSRRDDHATDTRGHPAVAGGVRGARDASPSGGG